MSISKILGAAAVAALAAGASGPAGALPDNETYTIYYGDAAHSTYSGTRIFTCGRGFYADGQISRFPEVVIDRPCGNTIPDFGSDICQVWDAFHGAFPNSPIANEVCPF